MQFIGSGGLWLRHVTKGLHVANKQDREKENMQAHDEMCEIIIPNNIVGLVDNFKNYDPKRIKRYDIEKDCVKLQMLQSDRACAMNDYLGTLRAFRNEVAKGEINEVEMYDRVVFDENIEYLDFYMRQCNYKTDIITPIVESELVIDGLYYQLYKGLEPGITVRYFSVDGAVQYAETKYPNYT